MNTLSERKGQRASGGVGNNSFKYQTPKQQKSVAVLFPCVHGVAAGQLVKITCFGSSEMKGPIKVIAGVDDEAARRIIGAARHGETDERAANGVIALFSNPLFGGASFGLALAIADKMTRFGALQEQRKIVATGRIPADGCGSVEAIGDFEAKLGLVEQNDSDSILFIFPEKNLKSLSKDFRQRLDALEVKGIQWRAINHIEELDGILWTSHQKQVTEHKKLNEYSVKPRTNGQGGIIELFAHKGIIVGILLGLSLLLAILFFSQETLFNNNVTSTPDLKGNSQISTRVDSLEVGESKQPAGSMISKDDDVIESERLDTSAY